MAREAKPWNPPNGHESYFWSNLKSRRFSWLSAFIAFAVSLGSYIYVRTVLIDEAPPPKPFLFSPGHTVLTVNISAHVVAFLIWHQVGNTFEALRWAFASMQRKPGKAGIPLASFLALGRATAPLGVASLMLLPRPGWHLLWCFKRLSFMGLAWVLGIVLTSNVNYKNVYTSMNNQPTAVYAGLAPITQELGLSSLIESVIPSDAINFYYMTFCYSLLSDNRFSLAVQPISCSGPSCSSFFLPGGAAIVRDQNETFLFSGHEWTGETAVLIHNAPGYQMEFYPAPQGWRYNSATDCVAYGQTEGEGLYICLANNGSNLVAGWSVCPQEIWNNKSCFNDTSWQDQLDQITVMTVSKRYSTVAYSGTNFSILSMEYLSSPQVTEVPATELSLAVSKVLAPISHSVNASNPEWINTASTYSIQYGLGWGLRTYKNLYPGDESPPLEILYNFLAIPFQFSTTVIYGMGDNYLPADLKTNATIATVYYRAIAEPWVLTVYGAIAFSLSLWAMTFLFLACFFGGKEPKSSKFPEIDLISRYPEKRAGQSNQSLPQETALGLLRRKDKDGGRWMERFRGFLAGTGVLELISIRKVRFGLPDSDQVVQDPTMTRTFISEEHTETPIEEVPLTDSDSVKKDDP